ncbi:MAG: DEAD/DEAH box helicase [Candidatus Micrarchaeia archaeon]
MNSFKSLNIKQEIVEATENMNMTEPTEVQAKAIPEILSGKDVIVRAKTGTGKTLAFLIPVLNNIHQGRLDAVVVVPTRELAKQVHGVAQKLCNRLAYNIALVYGGVSIDQQIKTINRGVEMIIGTPGRLLDLVNRGAIDLSTVHFLVLDEADIMFDMGFIDDVERIIEGTSDDRQLLMFSATMPFEVKNVAKKYAKEEVKTIEVGNEDHLVVGSIKNLYTTVSKSAKFSTLLAYLEDASPKKAIIFVRTQSSANIIYKILSDFHSNVLLLHGGMTQARREIAIKQFRETQNGLLIATNVAARGLDISNITDIINFDAPEDPAFYVHRVGRSARMGKDGRAFTIFESAQQDLLRDIEDFSGANMIYVNVDSNKFKNVNFSKYFTYKQRSHSNYHRQENKSSSHFAHHFGNKSKWRQH